MQIRQFRVQVGNAAIGPIDVFHHVQLCRKVVIFQDELQIHVRVKCAADPQMERVGVDFVYLLFEQQSWTSRQGACDV